MAWLLMLVVATTGVVASGCVTAAGAGSSATGIPDPARSLDPNPDFSKACAPTGVDSSLSCVRVILQAIDNARAREHVAPMLLPDDFTRLSVPEQMLVVTDRERVDRGLAPFVGLTQALDANAQRGANTSTDPPDPGSAYDVVDTEWSGGTSNGLDADYGWMYDDGPGSGNLDCPKAGLSGCWGHRHGILDDFGNDGTLVMGAAVDPVGDTDKDDAGGTSMTTTLAITRTPPSRLVYTWADAERAMRAGTIRPAPGGPANASITGIADPPASLPPVPDYRAACLGRGLDDSQACTEQTLSAIDAARAKEGLGVMVLPSGFSALSVPEQLLVVVDRERVDRGLAPFVGLTAALDAAAQAGAGSSSEPKDLGPLYLASDTEWVGGVSSVLDADYDLMYDDGPGNIPHCSEADRSGCWADRHLLLDNLGTGGTLVMGAGIDPAGDTSSDDRGGTSLAMAMAVQRHPPTTYVYTWAQAQQ